MERNGNASEDTYGWRLPRSLFANVDRLPRFTLLNQSRVFGQYLKRTQWLEMNRWIHSGQGFIGSFDLPWSEWSRITDPDHPKGMHPKCFVLIIPLFIVRCLKLQSPLSKARNRKLHLKMWMAIKWLAIWRRIHQVRQTTLIFRISIHFYAELSSDMVGLAKSWF